MIPRFIIFILSINIPQAYINRTFVSLRVCLKDLELYLIHFYIIALRCISLVFVRSLKHRVRFVWARIRQRMTMPCYCRMLMLRGSIILLSLKISWSTSAFTCGLSFHHQEIKECWCCYFHFQTFHMDIFYHFLGIRNAHMRKSRMLTYRKNK